MTTPLDKGAIFKSLHDGPDVLVLANVWDVASARVVERAGHRALATSSAAVARSLGYDDGENTPVEEMVEAVRRIVDAVDLPVSADLEAGYADDADGVARTAGLAVSVGAVGMNLEDTWHGGDAPLRELADQEERVAAASEAAASAGATFVVNARTDVFLNQIGEESSRLDEAVRRATAYVEAGAASIFVPGVSDPAVIGALAREIPAPLNVLVWPGMPPIRELAALGVRRVSLGSWPHYAAMNLLDRIAKTLLTEGEWPELGVPGPEG